jgi:hypothetical protein
MLDIEMGATLQQEIQCLVHQSLSYFKHHDMCKYKNDGFHLTLRDVTKILLIKFHYRK